jgi:hypothetical protein
MGGSIMFIVKYTARYEEEFYAQGITIEEAISEVENITGDIFDNDNAEWFESKPIKIIQETKYTIQY